MRGVLGDIEVNNLSSVVAEDEHGVEQPKRCSCNNEHVDRDRGVVWVNGNQSDTILSFDIASESWKVYPMPRQRFFTRDIEISEEDGAVYTTNSHFPTWQSEGGVPTLLRITPLSE